MVINFHFVRAVVAGRLNVKNVALVPIRVVDCVEPVLSRVEQIFSIHNIFQDRINDDISWKVNYLNIQKLELCSV